MDDMSLPGAACERRTVITPNVFAVIPCYFVPEAHGNGNGWRM